MRDALSDRHNWKDGETDEASADAVAVVCDLTGRAADQIAAHTDIFVWTPDRAEVIRLANRRRLVGVLLRSEVTLDRDMLEQLPDLTFVIRVGNGVDNIDVQALEERGIGLLRNPDGATASAAELAWVGILSLARQIPRATALMRDGLYAKRQIMGEDIRDLTTAIWGAGRIGRAILAIAERWEAPVRIVDLGHSVPEQVHLIAPEAAMQTADVHVVCLPLTRHTRGQFGRSFLESVAPRRPYLCNIARYQLVDMKAAVDSLRRGQLRGLFVDPIDEDHLNDFGRLGWLEENINIMFTPHLGAQRSDARDSLDEWAVSMALNRVGL